MWNKREDELVRPATAPQVALPPAATGERKEPAVIGASISIVGDVTGGEDITILGKVEGKIALPKHSVTVGQSGRVSADIQAKMVSVAGEVRGNLVASEQIVIRRTATMLGNLTAPGWASRTAAASGEASRWNRRTSPAAPPRPPPRPARSEARHPAHPPLTRHDVVLGLPPSGRARGSAGPPLAGAEGAARQPAAGGAAHRARPRSALAGNIGYLSALSCRVRIADLFPLALRRVDREPAAGDHRRHPREAAADRAGRAVRRAARVDVFDYMRPDQVASLMARLTAACRPEALVLLLASTRRQIPAVPCATASSPRDAGRRRPARAAPRRASHGAPDLKRVMPRFAVRHSILLRSGVQEFLFARSAGREAARTRRAPLREVAARTPWFRRGPL